MAKALLDDSSSESSDSGSEDIQGFKVNEEFAKRFEHNKKREERQRLEEKYGSSVVPQKRKADEDETDDSDASDSSTSEEEDDAAILATIDVDQQIKVTLDALRKKDPSIYDSGKKFFEYKETDDAENEDGKTKAPKPIHLVDYQRQRLLGGNDDSAEPGSFVQQQNELRKQVVGEMNAAINEDDEEDTDFLRPKKREIRNGTEPLPEITESDVKNADKNPELYLSNFISSRAWVPSALSRFQPFDSDDDEEEERADEFEQAYNMRFEDPAGSKEKLLSHARDTVAKYSVRRSEKSIRKRAREAKREKKDEEQHKRESEKARLKKLRVEEAEQKLDKICEAAGIRRSDVNLEDWAEFLEDAWDDSRWDEKMAEKFGDNYHADMGDDSSSKKKLKKPKWDDDIDIKDLVPDFDDEDQVELSDDEAEDVEMEDAPAKSKRKSKKAQLQERKDRQKAARQQRAIVEDFVEKQLDLEGAAELDTNGQSAFRYRESTPESYGLTVNDILMASDSQLNQYAGLKKLAAYRDPQKKAKDRQKLSKKGRLRQWRKETFGNDAEPVFPKDGANGIALGSNGSAAGDAGVDIVTKKHKKSKSKKGKESGKA